MKFECEINMDNAVFDEPNGASAELSDILKRISREVDEFDCVERTKAVWDYNGNKIGTWKITNDR